MRSARTGHVPTGEQFLADRMSLAVGGQSSGYRIFSATGVHAALPQALVRDRDGTGGTGPM